MPLVNCSACRMVGLIRLHAGEVRREWIVETQPSLPGQLQDHRRGHRLGDTAYAWSATSIRVPVAISETPSAACRDPGPGSAPRRPALECRSSPSARSPPAATRIQRRCAGVGSRQTHGGQAHATMAAIKRGAVTSFRP